MPNPVVHWEIATANAGKVQEFYRTLFDWHIDANNSMDYGMVDTHAEGGINGGICDAMGQQRVTVYVQVADLQATLDRAEKLGGQTLMPPTEIPDAVTMAMFSDPDGNIIGLIKG